MELSDWRRKIDAINEQLLKDLNERARCAQAIGELKRQRLMPVYDPERENQIIESLLKQNDGPLSDEAVKRIFLCVIEETRKFEEKARHFSP